MFGPPSSITADFSDSIWSHNEPELLADGQKDSRPPSQTWIGHPTIFLCPHRSSSPLPPGFSLSFSVSQSRSDRGLFRRSRGETDRPMGANWNSDQPSGHLSLFPIRITLSLGSFLSVFSPKPCPEPPLLSDPRDFIKRSLGGYFSALTVSLTVPKLLLRPKPISNRTRTVSYQSVTVLDGFPVTPSSSNCSITALAVP